MCLASSEHLLERRVGRPDDGLHDCVIVLSPILAHDVVTCIWILTLTKRVDKDWWIAHLHFRGMLSGELTLLSKDLLDEQLLSEFLVLQAGDLGDDVRREGRIPALNWRLHLMVLFFQSIIDPLIV